MYTKKPSLFVLAILAASSASSFADDMSVSNFTDWLSNGNVNGDIRVYDFSRDYAGTASNSVSNPSPLYFGDASSPQLKTKLTDMNAFSLGGKVKAQTANWDGFTAALAYYFAYDVGLNNYTYNSAPYYKANDGLPYLNPLLMGTTPSLGMLGEAYLQYENKTFMLRAGNELINNPWNNPSDGFMIPNLFEGISTKINLTANTQFSFDRILDYKNRTNDAFSEASLALLPYDKVIYPGQSGGAVDAGLTWKNNQGFAQAWYYDWYGLTDMVYFEGGYSPTIAGQHFFIDFQNANEQGSADIGSVNADIYGFKGGIKLDQDKSDVFLAYNQSVKNRVNAIGGTAVSPNGAFQGPVYNGNFYSPYTFIYNTDPLYTTVMNYGLVSARAPGSAWMLGSDLHPMKQLDILPTVSWYYTAPYVANATAYMLDIAWHCSGALKGLTIRNRLGIEHDIPFVGTAYVDNRLMIQYNF